jgi:glyoxylase-like metal-dependent hydrolase (beta-lactamase superfamily II)
VPELLAAGVARITFRLPLGIDHVHCYGLRSDDGSWTIVDAGLDLPGVRERWAEEVAALDGPVERVFVTHMHPDHIGASATLAEVTGAEVLEGRLDREQALAVWRDGRPRGSIASYLREHGMPDEEAAAVQGDNERVGRVVRLAEEVTEVEAGGEVAGWEAVHLPGHADGHLSLCRDGVLVAGDALLGDITPNVGLWPNSRPDPLADYLESLHEIVRRAPHVAYPGHGEVIHDPAARATEILEHHDERLEQTADTLRGGPRNAYDVSLALFPGRLPPALRRFALVESLAHLEFLARRGELVRGDGVFALA